MTLWVLIVYVPIESFERCFMDVARDAVNMAKSLPPEERKKFAIELMALGLLIANAPLLALAEEDIWLRQFLKNPVLPARAAN